MKQIAKAVLLSSAILLSFEAVATPNSHRTGVYYVCDSHRIYDIRGGHITLENGTVWVLSTLDLQNTSGWRRGDVIEARPLAASGKYPYEYVFSKRGFWKEEARARIVEIPQTTPFISGIEIDFLELFLYLSDGSRWQLDSFDRDVIQGRVSGKTWEVGDFIMLGSNQGFNSRFSYSYPQLVINLSTGDYAHGKFSY